MKKLGLLILSLFVALTVLNVFFPTVKVIAENVEDKLLVSDDGSSLLYISKSLSTMDIIRTENGNISRNYSTETAQGPKGLNDKTPKYMPAEIVYKTYADIKCFEVNALVYLFEKGYQQYSEFPALEGSASYRVEFHVSANAQDWQVVPVNLQAYCPSDEVLYPSDDFCGITFTNKEAIPVGSRYLKIILVGQVTVISAATGSEYVLDGSDGFANISSNPNYSFEDIYCYWNSWAPIVEDVKIYADANAEIETAVDTISTSASKKTLRKGETYHIAGEYTLSTDKTKQKITDFSEFNVKILSGGEYVNVNAQTGEITVKDNYSKQNETVAFQIEKDGVASDVHIISLIMPVETVTLITEKRSARIGTGYVAIGIEVYPFTATNTTPDWVVTDANGNDMSDCVSITPDGMLKPLKEGVLKIGAIVDGVTSNTIDFKVEAQAAVVINNKLKLNVGDVIDLSATVTPSSAAGLPITWSVVDDDGVVSVSGNKLTVNKVGIFTIKASIDGASAEIYGEAWSIPQPKKQKGCSSTVGAEVLSFGCVSVIAMFLNTKKWRKK